MTNKLKQTFQFGSLSAEYAGLWAHVSIERKRAAELGRTARHILENRPRYDAISLATNVPWFVVGIIHSLECGLRFDQHLHNGDSLNACTHQEPKGRPAKSGGPFTWEESAIDALTMKGKEFHKITDWSVERCAWVFESYNGWGYRLYHPEVHSAYLWSYTSLYQGGKYIADKVWSSTAMSEQPGAMALLKTLIDIAPDQIVFTAPSVPVRDGWVKAQTPQVPGPVATAAKSGTIRLNFMAGLMFVVAKMQAAAVVVGAFFAAVVSSVGDIVGDATGSVAAFKDMAALVGAAERIAALAAYIGVVCLLWAAFRHGRDKMRLNAAKAQGLVQ